MPQPPSKQAPWDLTQFSQLPSAALLYFPEAHWWSEISSLSKVILVLRKARSCRSPHLGCRVGAESPGRVDVLLENVCTRRDVWAGTLLWWSCKSPVAHSCGLPNHRNSFHRGMFQLNAKFYADPLLYSLSHFECDALNGIHRPHWLVQWCHHCSHMNIPVHSPWLPGYIDVSQSVLVILSMVGLFLDRFRIYGILTYMDTHNGLQNSIIVKMSILLTLICQFNIIPMKIPVSSFEDVNKISLKSYERPI